MAKLIPPRRDEAFSNRGLGTVRMLEYLEENAKQTNDSTDVIESDQSNVSLSSAQLSQANKKVAELFNEGLISQAGLISNLVKRIEQLENTITESSNSNITKRITQLENTIINDSSNNKKFAQLENDFIAPFYKTRYDKLTIKKATISEATLGEVTADNITISEKLNVPLTNDATNPTINFGDGDSGWYEESDDTVALSLGGTKRYAFSAGALVTPNGTWSGSGISINTGDTYRVNGVTILNATTLGASVLASSLTSVGTLTNVNTSGAYSVDGTQVVSNQGSAVTRAAGGATIDAEARTSLNALLDRLEAHGLIA